MTKVSRWANDICMDMNFCAFAKLETEKGDDWCGCEDLVELENVRVVRARATREALIGRAVGR